MINLNSRETKQRIIENLYSIAFYSAWNAKATAKEAHIHAYQVIKDFEKNFRSE